MRRKLTVRITVQSIFAILSGSLAILTAVERDWVERLTGLDPDQGSGALEVVIVLVFAIVAIVLAIRAVMAGRRLRTITE